MTVGSNIDIKDTVEENAIGMAQGGLLMGVQVIHSKKGLLVDMLPKNLDLVYVQKHIQFCIIEAMHKTIDERSNPPSRKEILKTHGDFKILVDLAYPLSNFEHQQKGTRTSYNTKNKQMFGMEYNKASEAIIITSVKTTKPLLRKVIGVKSFM